MASLWIYGIKFSIVDDNVTIEREGEKVTMKKSSFERLIGFYFNTEIDSKQGDGDNQ